VLPSMRVCCAPVLLTSLSSSPYEFVVHLSLRICALPSMRVRCALVPSSSLRSRLFEFAANRRIYNTSRKFSKKLHFALEIRSEEEITGKHILYKRKVLPILHITLNFMNKSIKKTAGFRILCTMCDHNLISES
jgi:hypothetical protein